MAGRLGSMGKCLSGHLLHVCDPQDTCNDVLLGGSVISRARAESKPSVGSWSRTECLSHAVLPEMKRVPTGYQEQ